MNTKFILTILTISLSVVILTPNDNGSVFNNNNLSKIIICKDGAGCLNFGQILTNKCSENTICHNQAIFGTDAIP